MGKCLVGFSHPVGIFFFLESAAFPFTGCHYFPGEFVGHAFTVAVPAVADEPFDAEGYLTVGPDFRRNLESRSPDPAASYFYRGSHVIQSPSCLLYTSDAADDLL